MLLDTLMVPSEAGDGSLSGRTAVLVDVLRASTTMVAALDAGCREIVPSAGIDEASRLAETLGRTNVLLCGERDGRKIEGFDLGNSPLEFVPEVVRDKTLIMSTTNGTVALSGFKQSVLSLVASFNNAGAVCQALMKAGADAMIVCAGKLGRFSMEDLLCAGVLAEKASKEHGAKLSDSSKVALLMYRKHSKTLAKTLARTQHGSYLVGLGFKDDISFCANIDSSLTVPVLQEGRIMRSA